MTIDNYIQSVSTRLQSGISREHSYRGDLETLIRELVTDVEITNEPANITDCGNPDYVITKGKIPIGYIETKGLGFENILHYQKIIVALFETHRIKQEIDLIEVEQGVI